MFPNEFDYHRAESVDHAIELMEDHPDAEVLAGGHSLLPMIKTGLAQPPAIIDIGRIDSLRGVTAADGETRIGALTTYAAAADDPDIQERHPAVAEAAGAIGDIQVRNAGTVGGNVAHSDPASDLPGAVLAADATMVVRGPDGERTVPADDFFLGMYETDVGEDELLTEVVLPDTDTVGAYVKRASPSSGYAIVGVAAVLETDGDRITSARLGANGVQQNAFRLEPIEERVTGEPLEADSFADVPDLSEESVDEFQLMGDQQASEEFRTHLLGVYAQRALENAADESGAA